MCTQFQWYETYQVIAVFNFRFGDWHVAVCPPVSVGSLQGSFDRDKNRNMATSSPGTLWVHDLYYLAYHSFALDDPDAWFSLSCIHPYIHLSLAITTMYFRKSATNVLFIIIYFTMILHFNGQGKNGVLVTLKLNSIRLSWETYLLLETLLMV